MLKVPRWLGDCGESAVSPVLDRERTTLKNIHRSAKHGSYPHVRSHRRGRGLVREIHSLFKARHLMETMSMTGIKARS